MRYTLPDLNVTPSLDVVNKRRILDTIIDPDIPKSYSDSYIVTVYGDRLDLLAYTYLGDATNWWMIAAANPELRKDSVYLDPGIQIRIPSDPGRVISLIVSQNQSR